MEFAQILSKLMEFNNNMSNYRLAALLQCHQSTIAYWLDGTRTPRKSMIPVVANVFGVTQDQLLGKEPIDFEHLKKAPVNPTVGPAVVDEDEDSNNDEIIKEIAGNPYSRALFYAMKGATPEEYKQAAELVKMIRRTGK